MDFLTDHVFLSRLQFALMTIFHITWPIFSIGLALLLVFLEAMWLWRKNPFYIQQFKFWSKLFLLCFAVGVVSGIPLEFAFGANWGPFSRAVGNFFGQILGFEGTIAFMLEAAFLYIMVFGWHRVKPAMHFLATCMVALGTSVSAFWIMVANSWMQTPDGGHLENGLFVVDDWFAATFNTDLWYAFVHMWVACLQSTIFAVGAVSAWYLLKGRDTQFFLKSFKMMAVAALVVTPLQALIGDLNGQEIGRIQPAKVAAIEAHWETNAPGEGASWNMLAWPDTENEKNLFEIPIPYGLSLLITHSFTGTVPGLKDFPKQDRPPIVIPFYTFRTMVGIGFGMVFLALYTVWAWYKKRLTPQQAGKQKRLLYLWMLMLPLSWVAVETGWITREVGRQPWTVYGLLRTTDAASTLPPDSVVMTLLAYTVAYALLLALFLHFARRVIRKGPDLSPVASHKQRPEPARR